MSCLIKLSLEKAVMIRLLILLIGLSLSALFSSAQNFPKQLDPPKLVSDYTLTLQPQETQALENKLLAYEDSTSTQIAIVIIRTTDGYPIDEYSFELGEAWGIGSQKDNGLLILIAKEDRDMWIATGYGVEGAVTDAMAGRIYRNILVPNFRENKFYKGLDQATDVIIKLLDGEFKNDDLPEKNSGSSTWSPLLLIILFILLVLFLKFRQVKNYAVLNELPFWTAWHILNAANAQQRGKWDDFRGGRGPFGGGGGMSGSSGGGFGGFGGGSFGGGGAGGSW